jgi:hypothetical protein
MPTNVATARTDWLAALVWRHLKRHRDARSYSPLSAIKRAGGERAAALDLLAGGRADTFVSAAATLAEQGDLALALEILGPGLLRHPDSRELAELRQTVLVRLMEQRQWSDPFGFLFYADLAGAELARIG